MTRTPLPGAWYTDVTPGGDWAALYRNTKIDTSRGEVPRPPRMDNLVHLRCADRGPLCITGQGQRNDERGDGQAWLWNGEKWLLLTPFTAGQKPVAFGPEGVYVAQPGNVCSVYALTGEFVRSFACALGSGGIQYVTDAGEVVTGDSTYQSKQLAEWTQLDDLRIGGGYEGGALFLSNGELRELEPGGCYFIHGYRDGSRLAVSTVKQDEDRAVLFWLDVSEIPTLPLVTQNPLPTTPNPEIPRPEPAPMEWPNLLPIVERVRAKYPPQVDWNECVAMVNEIAIDANREHPGMDFGLLKKDGGNRGRQPLTGIECSVDWLVSRVLGLGIDCFRDAGNSDFGTKGPAATQWGHGEPFDLSKWTPAVAVNAQPQPVPTPTPGQPKPPSQPKGFDALIAETLAPLYLELAAQKAQIAALKVRIETLQAQPSPSPSFPSRIALRTAHGKYVCAEGNDKIGALVADRDGSGPWETFDVEVKE